MSLSKLLLNQKLYVNYFTIIPSLYPTDWFIQNNWIEDVELRESNIGKNYVSCFLFRTISNQIFISFVLLVLVSIWSSNGCKDGSLYWIFLRINVASLIGMRAKCKHNIFCQNLYRWSSYCSCCRWCS